MAKSFIIYCVAIFSDQCQYFLPGIPSFKYPGLDFTYFISFYHPEFWKELAECRISLFQFLNLVSTNGKDHFRIFTEYLLASWVIFFSLEIFHYHISHPLYTFGFINGIVGFYISKMKSLAVIIRCRVYQTKVRVLLYQSNPFYVRIFT